MVNRSCLVLSALVFTSLLLAAPATAQDEGLYISTDRTGQAAVAQPGQRKTREQVASNVPPLNRVENRIANRVQSRIRNRIDRFYDPQANAASPFKVAEEQIRTVGRPRRH